MSVKLTPVATTATFEITCSQVKRVRKLAVKPSVAKFDTNILVIHRIRSIAPNSITVSSSTEPVKMKRRRKLMVKPSVASFTVDCSTVLYYPNPIPKPEGSITVNGKPLNGQRLRGGDFHILQIFIRGHKLSSFQVFFNAASTSEVGGKILQINKSQGMGVTPVVLGVDPTTSEDTLTCNIFLYRADTAAVTKETEFRFELEVDDLLGVRYGLIADNSSFTVYPDAPP